MNPCTAPALSRPRPPSSAHKRAARRLTLMYSDRRWRAKRAAHLAKEPLCRYCAREGRLTPGDVADHIIPHRGDRVAFFRNELQTLCHHHHSSTKQIEETQGPSRLERRQDPDSHWSR